MCDFENSEISIGSDVIVIYVVELGYVLAKSSSSPYRLVVESIATIGGQCGDGGCRVLSMMTKVYSGVHISITERVGGHHLLNEGFVHQIARLWKGMLKSH